MNMKRKSLVAALFGAGALAASGAANAVYVNQDGLGEALVYPYYTVRNGNNTLMSVVNTTDQGKVVKVRFREGRNSADVLDFLLFLSPWDVWTAAVTFDANDSGPLGGGRVLTRDTSCVFPTTDEEGNSMYGAGIPFRAYGFTGTNADARAADGIDRAREGYIEIIETATVPRTLATGGANPLYDDIKHSNGTPGSVARTPSCTLIGTYVPSANIPELEGPSGGLFGSGTIINPNGGTSVGYTATAFNAFWEDGTVGQIWTAADESPNFNDGEPVSVVISGTSTYVSTWVDSIDAVSATIMHSRVLNEYAYTADRNIQTDWVVTFPTKRSYVNRPAGNPALDPFQNVFGQNGACDDVSLASYDREEGFSTSQPGFSPRPPTGTNSLCWEANVISFGGLKDGVSSIYGSKNALGLMAHQNNGAPVPAVGAAAQGEGGWLSMAFNATGKHRLISGPTEIVTIVNGAPTPSQATEVTYHGLPVVGFATAQFNAGQAASYDSGYAHRYVTRVTE